MYDEDLCTSDPNAESDPYYTCGSIDVCNPSEDDMLTMFESTMQKNTNRRVLTRLFQVPGDVHSLTSERYETPRKMNVFIKYDDNMYYEATNFDGVLSAIIICLKGTVLQQFFFYQKN